MGGFWVLCIVVASLLFVLLIIKMGIDYALKVEKLKRGYPLEDGKIPAPKAEEYVDYGRNN